ncbi:MAG: hypothetical protein AVDCRST_MAG53-1626 [uncultured Solirubrobacteraceae bacterium]|uniref:HTH luxR-type domain-containing protein n=1 Tax=uncultured Solirubrobacteraceae bacterium TaxID=1162706 RepID=A0A6J4S9U4_9ACTN|nr:MAG: hypothetical protein AVDCRST_MAG53-1626 [uncultured Solirubrobacteraceae bacterium]
MSGRSSICCAAAHRPSDRRHAGALGRDRRSHVANLLRKLGVRSREAAVAMATDLRAPRVRSDAPA